MENITVVEKTIYENMKKNSAKLVAHIEKCENEIRELQKAYIVAMKQNEALGSNIRKLQEENKKEKTYNCFLNETIEKINKIIISSCEKDF